MLARIPWYEDAGAWQWDAMIVFGLASLPIGFATLATAVTARAASLPTVLLALHASVIGVAVALMLVASVGNRAQLTVGWLASVGAGTALIYVRCGRARLALHHRRPRSFGTMASGAWSRSVTGR